MPDPSSPETNANLVQRLLADWPDLSGELLTEGLGAYAPAGVPDDHYDELRPAIAGTGYAVLAALAAGQVPSHDEIRGFVGPVARQHAEERLPLPVLMTAIHASAQVLLAHAAATARPDETSELVAVGSRLLQVLTSINLVVVDAYLADSPLDSEREARRELCDALVHGRPAAGLAARADTVVADRYLVVTVLLDVDPEVAPPNMVLHRRKRVLQNALDELTTDITPARFDGVEGVALIAGTVAESDAASPRWAELAAGLTEEFGVGVYLAFLEDVPVGEIPKAAVDAAELGRLAKGLNRGPGAYRIDQLLLEFQVTRPSPARDRLAERVEPLFDQPHLLEALHSHLQFGADRKSAAAQVHVHPNTYTYRLRRIHELTGLDPTKPRESRMLAAALMVAGKWDGLASDARL
ncbi:PucR family transcriptional regulator [Gordonia sp. FQ]|uniref:PucR family transcriptional regulator n=1 Tax=Gordonia sp. FQ TaxID=3446634 RepID=UPI003F842D5F